MIFKEFNDGTQLKTSHGKFDDWLVSIKRPDKEWHSPSDEEYFEQLLQLSQKYSSNKVYADYVTIFDATCREYQENLIAPMIENIAGTYSDEDSLEVEILFYILYATMLAEQNRIYYNNRPSRMGKNIKRLGIHQVLIEGVAPSDAAKYSKGKNALELEAECLRRGFWSPLG